MRGRRRAVGGGRGCCDCTNISIMQLFHELKQQFPAVPDEQVTACISDNCHDRSACRDRLEREQKQLPRALIYPPSLMGARMTESAHRLENNERATATATATANANANARPSAFPTPLQTKTSPDCSEQPASPSGKPPISPGTNKRFGATKSSPTKPKPPFHLPNIPNLREEIPSPTNEIYNNVKPIQIPGPQRTTAPRPSSLDLTGAVGKGSVNLSVNVNCSVDVLATPPRSRKHSALNVTPEPGWCRRTIDSPRSFTSVNLTLRTPTSEPLPPIDICSANSSLTYSTSSFDSRQGLQSRLQITVGPGGGNVTAIRSRPSSSYHPDTEAYDRHQISARAGSMPDLVAGAPSTAPAAFDANKTMVSRQLERKKQLKSELEVGRERLMALNKEVKNLRIKNTPEYREQLRREIKHLRAQCEMLTREVDRKSESRVPLGETDENFYRNIYPRPNSFHPPPPRPHVLSSAPQFPPEPPEADEPRWPCHICTFRNHPLMNRCEQCDMPRILLGNDSRVNNNVTNQSSAASNNPILTLGMNT